MKNRTVKLGDILGYEQPTKYIVNSTNYSDEYEIPVLTAGQSFILGYTNETDGIYTDLPAIIFDDFTTATKYVDFPFKVKSSAMKILKADGSIADDRYMFYQMQLIQANNDEHKRYWISKYSQFPINLPPLETQKKIAAILDAADAYRQKTKALIAKYDELTQSLFLEMFGDPVRNEKGWEENILGQFCKKVQIGPFGSQLHQSDYVEQGIPLINPTNIKNGLIDYKSSVKISITKYESLPNYHLAIGDIVMARRGDLSKIGIVDRVKTFCGTGSLFMRLKDEINPVFAYFLLSHRSTVDRLYEQSQGVTMANLNKKIIVHLPIVVPPIILQNQFADRIQKIEAQKVQVQQSLEKAEELFNSLLQRAFKGELV